MFHSHSGESGLTRCTRNGKDRILELAARILGIDCTRVVYLRYIPWRLLRSSQCVNMYLPRIGLIEFIHLLFWEMEELKRDFGTYSRSHQPKFAPRINRPVPGSWMTKRDLWGVDWLSNCLLDKLIEAPCN